MSLTRSSVFRLPKLACTLGFLPTRATARLSVGSRTSQSGLTAQLPFCHLHVGAEWDPCTPRPKGRSGVAPSGAINHEQENY
jgi:hypothetical protein